MPPSKSNTTCNECRARKVKCDGGPGRCSKCERLNFACSFVLSTAAGSKPERRRGPRACIQCRAQKSRCSGELPSCASCRERLKDCVYPDRVRPSLSHHSPRGSKASAPQESPRHVPELPGEDHVDTWAGQDPPLPAPASTDIRVETSSLEASLLVDHPLPTPATDVAGSSNSVVGTSLPLPLPSKSGLLHLISDFFRYLHPLPPYAFLNEVSITQRCLTKTLDEALLLALCAVTALHMGYTKYYPVSTTSWVQRAEQIIWSRVEQPSIVGIQTLVLIDLYHIESGAFRRAYMLLSLAARAASALRLHYERLDLDDFPREILRRVVWSLMLVDGSFSIGLRECAIFPPELIYLNLPCPEERFHTDQGCETLSLGDCSSLDGIAENGLLALYISESLIRRDSTILMRQARVSPQPMSQLMDLVEKLIRRLERLDISAYSRDTLQMFSKSRWLARYLGVHLCWHQIYCDSYRLFLSGYREAAPAVVISTCPPEYIATAARICSQHAQAILDILTDFSKIRPNFMIAQTEVAICGYHACRLNFFLSKSSSIPLDSRKTLEEASNDAVRVVKLLNDLFPRSTIMGHLIKDLERTIQFYNADGTGEPLDECSSQEADLENQPRFAIATNQTHRFLGVHSILRHAHFNGNVHEASDNGHGQDETWYSSAHARQTNNDMFLDSPTMTAQASVLEDSNFAQLELPNDFLTSTQPIVFNGLGNHGFWDGWSDGFWPNSFSLGRNADYM